MATVKTMNKPPLDIMLAAPRGFCAGVERAILIVEKALIKYGTPIYVRHEIVHNKKVVADLRAKGVVFIDELDEIPHHDLTTRPVIFSAHGVPKSVPKEARAKNMIFIDATCPLVSKVHREVEYHHARHHHILLIGHAGHPEVIGTMGQIEGGHVSLIETIDDAENFTLDSPDTPLSYVTQTTLSVDDTSAIIDILKRRFPHIIAPKKEDICYATTNRQQATKHAIEDADLLLVLGAANSSNSRRLVDLAVKQNCPAYLIDDVTMIDWAWFSNGLNNVRHLAITAGASAPESLVQGVINACQHKYDVTITEMSHAGEDITFKLPFSLRDVA